MSRRYSDFFLVSVYQHFIVFKIIELLDGDCYLLESLTGSRTYKYAHDRIRKIPLSGVNAELDFSEVEDGEESTSIDN